MNKNFLSTALMGGICCALSVTTQAQTLPANPAPNARSATSTHYRATYSANSYLQSEEDSSVSPVQTVITYKNGPTYHIRMVDDKVIELLVNDRKIPADSFYVYDNLTKKLALQIKADKSQAKLDKEQAEKDTIQAEKDELQTKEDRVQAERDLQQEKLDVEQAIRDKQQAERDQVEARIEKAAAEQEREAEAREMAQDREQAARDQAQAVEDRKQAERDRAQAVTDRAQAVEDRKQADRDRKQAAEDRAILKKLISEIIREGLVPDEKSLHSLSLDEDGFFINDKQQSDATKKKILENTGIKGGYRVTYSRDSR
ncbi:MAG TPA: hypothetical protein VNS58_10965 [Puia sp.]|nr:hypothetical protein [Puia sp.]